jgi:hypothetical protein
MPLPVAPRMPDLLLERDIFGFQFFFHESCPFWLCFSPYPDYEKVSSLQGLSTTLKAKIGFEDTFVVSLFCFSSLNHVGITTTAQMNSEQ